MGAFFANAFVQNPDLDAGRAKSEALQAIRAFVQQQGLVEVNPGEPFDRRFVVEADGRWVSIFDEGSEGHQEGLDQLAMAISSRLGTCAVTAQVHDSDVLELRLFRSNELVDRYNNRPSYFGRVSRAERQQAKGRPECWAPLLQDATKTSTLAKIWKTKAVFAEDTLRQTALLMGIGSDLLLVGEDDDAGDLRLRYANSGLDRRAPQFGLESYSPNLEVCVGYRQATRLSTYNCGGGTKGLNVVVHGEAVERNLVAVESIDLELGPKERRRKTSGVATEQELPTGQKIWLAAFPQLMIPEGAPVDLLQPDPASFRRTLAVGEVSAHVMLTGRTAGKGGLLVSVVPLRFPGSERTFPVSAHVFPTPRMPLRAKPTENAAYLRALEDRSALFLSVWMRLDYARAATVAVSMIERWAELFAATDSMRAWAYPTISLSPGALPRPTSIEIPTRGFVSSKGWTQLKSKLMSGPRVDCGPLWKQRPPLHGSFGDGFEFGLAGRSGDSEDPELPGLCLWIDAAGADSARLERATNLASLVAREIMVQHDGVQALLGRWGRPARIQGTLYEEAAGTYGALTRLSWLARFLRGVAVGRLWLGHELRECIDETLLRRVCPVIDHGPALELEIANEKCLDDVENALALLLPTEGDCQERARTRRGPV